MQLHQGDAADYVLKLAAEVLEGRTAPLDMVCVDAFDGNDDVPASLWSSGAKRGQLLQAQEAVLFNVSFSLCHCVCQRAQVQAATQSCCLNLT